MSNTTLDQDQQPALEENPVCLSEFAISYRMSVAVRNPTGKVKAAQRAVAEKFGCDMDKTTGGTYLLEQSYLKPLLDIEKEIRTFFAKNTSNLDKKTLISSGNYFRVQEFVAQAVPQFDNLKSEFLSKWESEIRPESEKALRNQRNSQGVCLFDQLTSSQLKWFSRSAEDMSPFYVFDFKEDSLPSGNLRGVSTDIIKGIRERIKQDEAHIMSAANQQLEERIVDALTKLRDKMKTYEEGSGNRMHDSILGNVMDLAERVPDMIIGESDRLVELCAEIRTLGHWDVDILKGNEEARVEVKSNAEEILSKLHF